MSRVPDTVFDSHSFSKETGNVSVRAVYTQHTDSAMDPSVNLLCPSALSGFLALIFPCVWLGSCQTINPNERAVVSTWGKYVGTSDTGCFCVNPMGVSLTRVDINLRSTELRAVRAVDNEGTPIIVSGVVSWRVISPKRALLEYDSYERFVGSMCLGAVKGTLAAFPFESATPTTHSIRTHPDEVSYAIISRANTLAQSAGCHVERVSLTDLQYAPEIAGAMLVRQQATATLKARKVIVDGAVEICEGAVKELEARGRTLDPETRGGLISNLVTVLCNSTVSPVVVL